VGALLCDLRCHWWQEYTWGGRSARSRPSPRGGAPRVTLTLFLSCTCFVVYRSRRIVAADIQSTYAMSQGTSRSPEALAINLLVFVTTRRKRGFVEAVPAFSITRCFHVLSKVPAKHCLGSVIAPMSVSESQVLQHLCALEKSSSEFLRALHTFIRLDEKGEYSLNLQQPESARLVNFLDEVTTKSLRNIVPL